MSYILRSGKKNLLVLLGLVITLLANASTDPVQVSKFKGKDGELTPGTERETIDEHYYDPVWFSRITDPANDIIQNVIALRIVENDGTFIQEDFTYTVNYDVTYTDINGVLRSLAGQTLTISYTRGQGTKYDARSYLIFDNARKVKIKINSAGPVGTVTSDVADVVVLENRMTIRRDYNFNVASRITSVGHETPAQSASFTSDELKITWIDDEGSGRTHYDVEWAWVDISALDRFKTGNEFDPDLIFPNNSSRVTIAATDFYQVPLLYDGEGYLFYRVRAVQYSEDGVTIKTGEWNSVMNQAPSAVTYYHYTSGYEPELNWQATTTYAEEGKRKTVVQYFDGSLRGRQTATKDNSTRRTVIAETLYDYQGRPAINILPAPTLDSIIEFAKNFNRFESAAYPKDLYDKLPDLEEICEVETPSLDSTSGSSLYYSSNNGLADQSFHQYIPSAHGFPYTETRYTPDASGRITAQGGVGPTFQLNTGKETKYYYGTADQKELDALFGTEVGNNMHYFKNMVRDANGQYSVSYVDMHGRTIATALAGTPPQNLDALSSYQPRYMTKNLLAEGSNTRTGRSVISTNTILVAKEGPHQFYYELGPQSAEIQACKPTNDPVCYDCYYDLEIRITSDCTDPIVITRKNFNFRSNEPGFTIYDTTCNTGPQPLIVDETFTLPEGEYNIVKTLSLSRDAQNWYKVNLFNNHNICKTLEDYYNQQYAIMIANSDCNATYNCDSCLVKLGTYSAFRATVLLEQGITDPNAVVDYERDIQASYDEAFKACKDLCPQPESKLTFLREMLASDLIPESGQYALLNENLDEDATNLNGVIITPEGKRLFETNTNRIFNIFNTRPQSTIRPYALPVDENGVPVTGGYLTNGEPDTDLPQNPPVGAADADFNLFSAAFKESWTDYLLYYHPEFPKYKYAKDYLTGSYDFDVTLETKETWASAEAANYTTNLLDLDPFFKSDGLGYTKRYTEDRSKTYRQVMQGYLTQNYANTNKSMWQLAWMAVNCKENDPSCGNGIPPTPPYTSANCPGDLNMVWKIFRTIYLAEKDRMVNLLLQDEPGRSIDYEAIKREYYEPRFVSVNDANTLDLATATAIVTSNNPEQTASDATEADLREIYTATCESYIQMWTNKLANCDQLNALDPAVRKGIIDEIMAGLKSVCIRGSDEDHPGGSSTVKPSDTGSPSSFEEVIRNVFQSHGISPSAVCSPFAIDFPLPYTKQPAIGNGVVITTQDECLCTRLSELQAEKAQIGYAGTLSQFLQYQHNVTIRQTLLDTLINGCTVGECKFYEPAITLPAIFSCGASASTCIDCLEYDKLKAEFKETYAPGFVITPNPQENEAALNANLYFQQFMNSRTGLGKNWFDYLAFEKACSTYMDSWNCGRLDSIVTAYYQSRTDTLYGAACRTSFTAYFNQAFGTAYTYAQIQTLFMKYCGHLPDVCQVELTCAGFRNVIDSFYQRYGPNIRINGNCQALFVSHFNDWFETDYTFEQLRQLFNSLCGGELDVCSQFDCSKLKEVQDSWNSCHRADQLDPDCRGQWATYFNGMMSTGLTPAQIDSLYSACGLPLNPCSPSVTCKMLSNLVYSYENMGSAACAGSGLDSLSSTFCTDCFVWYVNDKLGSSYSYSQLQALYLNNCGTKLDICEDKLDCSKLTSFLNNYLAVHRSSPSVSNCDSLFAVAFNQQFSVSYTYAQILALYQRYCGQQPTICKVGNIIGCAELTNVYKEFIVLYPQPSRYFGNDCQNAFVRYFNQHFGDTLTWADIQVYYLAQCGNIPPICTVTDSCEQVSVFLTEYNAKYGTLAIPKQVCADIFTQKYNKAFTSKVKYTWKDVERIYEGCGVLPPVCAETGTGFDASKVNNARAAFYAYYDDGLPENPDKALAEFFNQYYGTSFTDYAQLDQWSKDNFAIDLRMRSSAAPLLQSQRLRARTADLPPAPESMPPRLCGLSTLFPSVVVTPEDPCEDVKSMALVAATEQYSNYVQQQYNEFDSTYHAKCLSAGTQEIFTMRSQLAEYHYTLYYYDQAGNLVKTVPPKGVNESHLGEPAVDNWHAQVKAARAAGTLLDVDHTLTTNYRYNTLNQVVAQSSPDGGTSHFWYDVLGRLVVSQNAEQFKTDKYSYTKYDPLGRITEVGQLTGTEVMQELTQNNVSLQNWFNNADASREQITKTVYDEPSELSPGIINQQHMRNRVSYTYLQALASSMANGSPYDNATFYSYDIHGNVDVLLQHYNIGIMQSTTGNAFKKIEYDYDLISGKVNKVSYQRGVPDQFFHRYEYDAENKLVNVFTSPDDVYWERQAHYDYYRHGPLARTQLGELGVQGIDYAYTLQGWLKGVNSTSAGWTKDMGEDGKSVTHAAKDAYSFSLNYYAGDYKTIKSGKYPFMAVGNGLPALTGDAMATGKDLFNGNIGSMMVTIPKLGDTKLYGYRYDQLNRLKGMNTYTGMDSALNTFTPVGTDDYKERITYDPNGNIMSYLRNGHTSSQLAMDNLTYDYKTTNNQLRHVSDAVASTPSGYGDIATGQSGDNYEYDAIGNLIRDKAEGLYDDSDPSRPMVEWNAYGKISRIIKIKNGFTSIIGYTYDAAGNRIMKQVFDSYDGSMKWNFYVRDASGNTMAVYEFGDASLNNGHLTQTEVYLYGSSRLGVWRPSRDVGASNWSNFNWIYFPGATNGALLNTWKRGHQQYELSNHLGNVLATVSDRLMVMEGTSTGTTGLADYYEADVVSASDYYPFGMGMVGRKFSAGGYRFGFNGKEMDNEVAGDGNQYDYGFRIYNPRLGKFLSVDPLSNNYPMLTPYQYASNTPISAMDLDGLESKISVQATSETVNPAINTTDVARILRQNGLKNQIVNWLIPQLAISGDKASEFSKLSTEERGNLIKEAVSNYLTFNITENLSYTFSGDIKRTEVMSADLNYELIFGSKTSPKIGEFKEALNGFYDEYYSKYLSGIVDANKNGKLVNGVLKRADIVDNYVKGDFMSITAAITEQVATKLVDRAVEANIAKGILTSAAKGVASRALGTFTNLLSSLEAGAGSSTTEQTAARKRTEGDILNRNVLAALIFYFTNGNEFEKSQRSKMLENVQKPKQDNLTNSSNGNGSGL